MFTVEMIKQFGVVEVRDAQTSFEATAAPPLFLLSAHATRNENEKKEENKNRDARPFLAFPQSSSSSSSTAVRPQTSK